MKGSVVFGSAQFKAFERASVQRLERAALIATDRGAREAKAALRAGLGRLGLALGSTSDLEKGRVKRRGAVGFSASGVVFIRSRSDRTVGAIESYTAGAEIRPVKGRWLWIATKDIPSRIGRKKITPALYMASSLAQTIGPLVFIPGRHAGEGLLVVKNVTVSVAGRRSSARRFPKTGGVRAGREAREFIVAFVGIRRTSREARVSPEAIIAQIQSRLPEMIAAAFQ